MTKASKAAKFSFKEFLASQQAAGIILIACTVLSLILANSPIKEGYLSFWDIHFGLHLKTWSLEHSVLEWINDGLMAVFFLFVGLEIKREFVSGELANIKVALLPVLVALGGMLVPGLLYTIFNLGNGGNLKGFGIPMATDIAFALGVLSILGNKVPSNLKVFLMALAVIDDLGAIIVIAIFYGGKFSLTYFLLCVVAFGILMLLNTFKVTSIWLYIFVGLVLWYLMLHSGIHATIAGVLLALSIPYNVSYSSRYTLPEYLVHHLHKPINFVIMPIFAIANTAIALNPQSLQNVNYAVCFGIFAGLFIGKAIGILGTTYMAVKLKISQLPTGVQWKDVLGMGFLGGIGFTMSIFVTTLAFPGNISLIDNSKLAIIISSAISGLVGYVFLKVFNRQKT